MGPILIRGEIITVDSEDNVITDGAVLVEEGKIREVGKYEEVRRACKYEEAIGSERSIVMPGLINTHTHLSMTLFKGVLEGLTGMNWLRLAWSIEEHLTPEDIKYGAMLGCMEMLLSGTTCFADHYFQMDNVAEAVSETGVRGALAEAILDFGDESKGSDLADKGRDFVERWNNKVEGRITCLMGPHSTYTCTPSTLGKVRRYADELGVGIHLHLSEHRDEPLRVKRKWGKRPIELLDSLGFLAQDVLAAHVTFANDEELSILAKRRVNVNVNVYCKMKGGQGIARVAEMKKDGINVSLGTDGPASHNNLDMFEEMKLVIAAQALKYKDPSSISASEAIRMATLNGARALSLSAKTGSIEKGKEADIIVLDAENARGTPFFNAPVLAAQTLCGRDVKHVMVNGRLVVRDGEITTVKVQEVLDKAEGQFHSLMERSGTDLKSILKRRIKPN